MSEQAPPVGVLRAFAAVGPPRALTGGQAGAWRVGDLVLKRDPGTCHGWLGSRLGPVAQDGVRIALPVPTRRGGWRHDRWVATRWVDGRYPDRASPSGWLDVLAAGRAFHQAVARLPRPPCLDERQDPWMAADRAAWGEGHVPEHPDLAPVVRRLRPALEPLGRPQLVHGDLAGNVLVAAGLPPAVIDLSPYWRPPAYAEGIVVADALCWHEAPASLLERAGVPVAAVARGLLFRILTTGARAAVREVTAGEVADEARRAHEAAARIGL